MPASRMRPRSHAATAVAVAISLGLAGCGGGSQPPHRARPAGGPADAAATATPHHQRFTWLVRTRGAPPSIAAENRARGTGAWRLPGPRADIGGLAFGGIHGYPSRETVGPGQVERLFVNSPGGARVTIRVFRMGWYGGRGGREILRSRPLRGRRQPPCRHAAATGLTVCRWHPTLSFRIPPALPSGVYIARLDTRRSAGDVLFVVTGARTSPLLAMLPTATYEAYNAWGGDSLYPGGADRVGITGTTQGVQVSMLRPYDSVTGAGQFFARDAAMVRFLERHGYPVAYTTSEGLDASPGQAHGRRVLLDFGHSEYWSTRELAAFIRARNRGTNLLFLSSDTAAWRIRFHHATITAFKEHARLDPRTGQSSDAFPPTTAALTGTRYAGCITPRIPAVGPPIYRYYSWVPSPSLQPTWLFRGTGLSAGRSISGIVGYELDARGIDAPGSAITVGGGFTPCMPTGAAEPGEPIPPRGPGRADSVLYRARSGALVFSSGTLGWELGLEPVPSASPAAPRAPEAPVAALTRNLLARMLGHT